MKVCRDRIFQDVEKPYENTTLVKGDLRRNPQVKAGARSDMTSGKGTWLAIGEAGLIDEYKS